MSGSRVRAGLSFLAIVLVSGCPGATGAGVASPPIASAASPVPAASRAPALPAANPARPGKGLDLSGPEAMASELRLNGEWRIHVGPMTSLGDREGVRRRIGMPTIPGEVCYYTVRSGVQEDNEHVASFLSELGYKAKPIAEALAIVYAELEDEDFSGIGICCSPAGVSVCCAVRTHPVFALPIPRDPTEAPATEMQAVLEGVKACCEACKKDLTFKKPIAIVLAGSRARAPGLLEAAQSELKKIALPIAVRELRLAKDPETAVACGALVAARADRETPQRDPCLSCGREMPDWVQICPGCGKPR